MTSNPDARQLSGPAIRLLIGTNNALLKDLFEFQLRQTVDIELTASTELGASLLDLIPELQPDVLLVTPKLGASGSGEMNLVMTILSNDPQPRVITLSAGYLPGQVTLLSQQGVAGLLLESQPWHTLVQAIRSVHNGAFFATPSVVRSRLDGILSKLNATNRTHAVAIAIQDGYLPMHGATAPG